MPVAAASVAACAEAVRGAMAPSASIATTRAANIAKIVHLAFAMHPVLYGTSVSLSSTPLTHSSFHEEGRDSSASPRSLLNNEQV
jgi:hypothetical protein